MCYPIEQGSQKELKLEAAQTVPLNEKSNCYFVTKVKSTNKETGMINVN